MLGRGRSAIGLRSRQPQQLQRCRAHASGCARDQCGLAWLHVRDPMNHLPRSHVIQYHRRYIAIRDAVGDGKEVFGLTHEKLCKAAVHRKRRYPLAQFEPRHTSANRFHHPGELVPRYEWYLRRVRIVTGQHGQVGRAHARSADPHAKLPWAGLFDWSLDDLENFRSAFLCQHHCSICRCHAGGPVGNVAHGPGGVRRSPFTVHGSTFGVQAASIQTRMRRSWWVEESGLSKGSPYGPGWKQTQSEVVVGLATTS